VAADTKVPVYDEVVKITQAYFGPASHRFIDRQVSSHLGKQPEQLRQKDLKSLIDWIVLAMSMLVEDETMVKNYITDLKRLIPE
jgi:hypothetical protein